MTDISIAGTVLPIFAVILLGFGAVRGGFFPRSAIGPMGGFVINFCLPAILFTAVSQSPIHQVINPWYVSAYALGSLLVYWLVALSARLYARQSWSESGGFALGATVSNSAFVGAPVLIALYGSLPVNAFTMNVIVENVLLLPMALIVFETARAQAQGGRAAWTTLRQIGSNLVRNPIVGAIVLGLVVNLVGVSLPGPIIQGLGFLADAAIGVALFVIGGSLVGARLRGNLRAIGLVTGAKLLVHPALVALMVWWLPPFDPELQRMAILSAAMPMLSIYPVLAGRYNTENAYAAILMATTLASMASLALILALLY